MKLKVCCKIISRWMTIVTRFYPLTCWRACAAVLWLSRIPLMTECDEHIFMLQVVEFGSSLKAICAGVWLVFKSEYLGVLLLFCFQICRNPNIELLTLYEVHGFQVFPLILCCVHFLHCFLCWIETFYFGVVHLCFFCCLWFWFQIPKFIVKSIRDLLLYVCFSEFM